MKKESYKGIDILYDEKKKVFYTKVILRRESNSENGAYISSKNIDIVKSKIDQVLIRIASDDKPVKKAWFGGSNDDSQYKLVRIIFHDQLTQTVTIKTPENKIITVALSNYRYNKNKVFLCSPKNDRLISLLDKKQDEIDLIKKEKRTISDKLISFKSVL